MDHSSALQALSREIARARRALIQERRFDVVFPPLAALLGWIGLCLLGILTLLPGLAATLLGMAALAGVAVLVVRGVSAYRAPTAKEARDRLSLDSRLDLGVFDTLEDAPSQLDPLGLALWRREQERVRAHALRARAKPARVNWQKRDPLYLRYALPWLLMIALVVAGPATGDRIGQALLPDPGPLLGDKPYAIEAWATPAGYTGAAPVTLSDRDGAVIETPPSVEVTVRLIGPTGAPKLVFAGQGGRRVMRFVKAEDGAYEGKLVLPGPGVVKVVRFHTKAQWILRPTADSAPMARLDGPVNFGDGENIQFSYKASDDFGVRDLALRVTPVSPPPGLVNAKPHDTPLEAPAGEPKEANAEVRLDLATHPYAGLDVEVRVVAFDALGQEGVSESARVRLPEKIFLQPLAQAAVEIRRAVLWERRHYAKAKPFKPPEITGDADLFGIRTDEDDPRITRAPKAIRRAGRMIDALTMAPQDGYFPDLSVFSGFRLARATLTFAREIEDTTQSADILWHVALQAEYGDAADAKRAMEEAQKQLADALRRGASPEEIKRLTQALQQAMNSYMQALVQEALRNGQTPQNQEDMQEQQSLGQNDIQELMREIERRAAEGDMEGAQQLLQQLAQLMQNLEVQLTEGGGEGQEDGDQQLEQSLDELSKQMGEQRGLRDETEQKREDGEQGQGQQEMGERQEDLQKRLEEARKKARDGGAQEGDRELGEAGDAMDEAAKALKRGDLDGAAREQEEALRAMRRGAERLSEEAQKQGGREDEKAREVQSRERDPLGREMGAGESDGLETNVPAEMEKKRAREIMDELRRRAQDPRRPESERDYLRRLLDRFAGS